MYIKEEYFYKTIEGLIIEIHSSKILSPQNANDKGWNQRSDDIIRRLQLYKIGEGLFQYDIEKYREKSTRNNKF